MSPGAVQRVVQRSDGRYAVLRPSSSQRLLAAAMLVGIGALSLLPDDTGERLPLVISLPICAFMAVVAWAASRMRVELGPAVRISNFLRTLVIPWNDIGEFAYDSGACVVLVDGRRRRISAFSPGVRALPYIERQCRDAVRQMENRRKSRLDNRRGRPGSRTS